MKVTSLSMPLTLDGGGNLTAFSPVFTGELVGLHWIKPSSNGSNGGNVAVTGEATGESVLSVANVTSSQHWYPRGPIHTTAGVAELYASAGLPVTDRLAFAEDRLQIQVTTGGANAQATVIAVIDGVAN
jgi:hypothetical protein